MKIKLITQKILYLFLIYLIIIPCFFYTIFADDFIEEIDIPYAIETAIQDTNEPNILSKNVIVLDRKTESVLYEKNAYEKVPMASTTKIMTCVIALENSNLSDIVTISKKASSIHGSTLGIIENDKMTMSDLLYGLMLRSGNDCAIAIAEHISGSIEEFSILMNKKALKLGLKNTNFITPHGLDNDEHYTTAYELAILTNYALKNETFKQIVSTQVATITIKNHSVDISNTNELLGTLEGVYGVKTGFTFNAGRCLVSSVKRKNLDIIVVVLGADTKKIRTNDSKNLIEYAFKNFDYIDIYPIIKKDFEEYLSNLNKHIILEKTNDIPLLELCSLNNYEFPFKKEEISNLHTKIFVIKNFSYQTESQKKVGVITLYNKEKIVCSLDIIITNELKPNSSIYYFNFILKNWITNFKI